jgi:hypothetical protein
MFHRAPALMSSGSNVKLHKAAHIVLPLIAALECLARIETSDTMRRADIKRSISDDAGRCHYQKLLEQQCH